MKLGELQRIYKNILKEIETGDEPLLKEVLSKRLLISEEKSIEILELLKSTLQKAGVTPDREELKGITSAFISFSVLLRMEGFEKFTDYDITIVSMYMKGLLFDSGFPLLEREDILHLNLTSEQVFDAAVEAIWNSIEDSSDIRKSLELYMILRDCFSKYRDNIVINPEYLKKLKDDLFGDELSLQDFIEKFEKVSKDLSSIDGTGDKDLGVSVSKHLMDKLIAARLKPVNLASREERIFLALLFFKHLKGIPEEKRIALALIIADVLYLNWLYKEGFIDKNTLEIALKKIIGKVRQYDSSLPYYIETYLFTVWNAAVSSQSILDNLTEEALNEISEQLAIKEVFGSEENFDKTKEILQDFVFSILKEKPENKVEWLKNKLNQDYGINLSEEEVKNLDSRISKTSKALTLHGESEVAKYIANIDKVIAESNKEIMKYANYKDSFGLHGELAEEWHAKTFNIDAAVKRKDVKAIVLKRNTKNSVDISIFDSSGKECRRYQLKYGKDAKTTASYLEDGNYRGQRPLVPSDQVKEVTEIRVRSGRSPAVDRLEYDGVESKPLSREESERLKEKVREKVDVFNWEETVTFKDVFKEVSKDAAKFFFISLIMRGTFRLARGIFSENTTVRKELLNFLKSDLKENIISSIKVAVSGALIVASKKGFIRILKNASPLKIVTLVEVGFKSVGVIVRMVTGKVSFVEGIKEITNHALHTAAGIGGASLGSTIGATVGSVIPVVGTFIGGFIGGILGALLSEIAVDTSVKLVSKAKNKLYVQRMAT